MYTKILNFYFTFILNIKYLNALLTIGNLRQKHALLKVVQKNLLKGFLFFLL